MQSNLRTTTILFLGMFLLIRCQKEAFEPVDIFETEPNPLVEQGMDGMSVTVLPVELCSQSELYVNSDRVYESDSGTHIKGTVFSESLLGDVALMSGDFLIDHEKRFGGYGSVILPETGVFGEAVTEMADLFGAKVALGDGAYFINQKDNLPLLDDHCYFQFTLDPLGDVAPGVVGGVAMIGNTLINFKQMYLEPYDGAVLFAGDMSQYPSRAEVEKATEGASKFKRFKARATPKWSISDMRIGIAATVHFPFEPHTFGETLTAVIGDNGFVPFRGHTYLAGRIPVKSYPLIVDGEAVVQNDFSPAGASDLFLKGFDEAAYRMGINGKVLFGHDLLASLIPLDFEVELGRATLQAQFTLDHSFVKFAGEYDSRALYEKFLSEELLQYFPFSSHRGQMYVSLGTTEEDWEVFIETEMAVNIPGVGEQPLQEAYLHFTPSGIALRGKTQLPFSSGFVEVTGSLNRNGEFLLSGQGVVDLDFGKGVELNSQVEVEISNDGLFINGMMSLPGGVSDFAVAGRIDKDGLYLRGEQQTDIRFGAQARLATYLSLEASSATGVFLEGSMETPLQVAAVAVEGEISRHGLLLKGKINGMLDFGVTRLSSDLYIHASTRSGAIIGGMIDVPLVIIGGELEARGEILTQHAFKLGASTRVTLGFDGFASVSPEVRFGFSQSEIEIGARAEFCAGVCVTAGMSFNPNWSTGEVGICVEPFDVEVCL